MPLFSDGDEQRASLAAWVLCGLLSHDITIDGGRSEEDNMDANVSMAVTYADKLLAELERRDP